MSEDSFTEITNQSWFGRIKSAFAGIIIGLILFVAAFPLLFWNEGRSVKRYNTLKEGEGAVVAVPADNVDPANEGRLVQLTGTADTEDTLTDGAFDISEQAIRLKRTTKMYQWKESSKSTKTKKVGGGTTTKTVYSYTKEWSEALIRSQSFKKPTGHENPGSKPYSSFTKSAKSVALGAFILSSTLVDKINNFTPLSVSSTNAGSVELPEKVKPYDGGYYIGADPTVPKVGDLRISFAVVSPSTVSIVSKQIGNSFSPYKTKAGGTIELLQVGAHDAGEMFGKAHSDNKALTWGIRVGGFFMMFFGILLMLKPLSVFADVIPILGNIVETGSALIAGLIAGICSLITIAIAWIFYRPILAIILIAISIALAVVIREKMKSKEPVDPVFG
ncbi:TMEM43 family protein [Thermodesulfobacteriota bacterium]